MCNGCGKPRNESFDPDGPDYVAEAYRCHACEARDDEMRRWREEKDADVAGLHFVVTEAVDD